MRNFLPILVLILFSSNSFGQTNEGYVKYRIKIAAIDSTPELLKSISLLKDSEMEIYFSPGFARTDNKMGELYSISAIFDEENSQMLSLTKNMAGKYAQKLDTDSLGLSIAMAGDETEVTEYPDSTKKILGFQCSYVESFAYGVKTSYWVTNELSCTINGKSIIDPKIPGFPLWFSKIEQGVKMTYIAVNYREVISNKETIFSTEIPEDYTDVSNN